MLTAGTYGFTLPTSRTSQPLSVVLGEQVIARHAKAKEERHWHAGGSMFIGALAAGLLAATLGRLPWLAFSAFAVALTGIWGVHGPLLSWPAVFLQGPTAASGAPAC